MSVQAMSWVIDESNHKGGSLLVLMMIANHAKSDGSGAWPATTTLAKECRMSERQVRRIIDSVLEPSGELAVTRRAGRPHIYDLPLVRGATPENMSGVHVSSDASDVQGHEREMSGHPGHSEQQPRTFPSPTPDTAMSDEPKATELQPSRTIQTLREASSRRETETNGRRRDYVWESLVAIFGTAPQDDNYRGAWQRSAKEIRYQLTESGVDPNDPDRVGPEIARRFAAYKLDMPNASCTPSAFAKHFGRLANTPATRSVSKFEAARAERRLREAGNGG